MRYGGDSYTHFETMLRAEKNRLVFMEGNHAHEAVIDPLNQFNTADKFSQVSTLHQLENITSYPFMQRLVDGGLVRLHAMWFDIYTGNIFYFSKPHKSFIEITEENWDEFLNEKEREALNKQVKFGLRKNVMAWERECVSIPQLLHAEPSNWLLELNLAHTVFSEIVAQGH